MRSKSKRTAIGDAVAEIEAKGRKFQTFGEYLKYLRKEARLSLREVEAKSEVSNAYISLLERNKRGRPTVDVLKNIANAYSVPVSEMLIMAGTKMPTAYERAEMSPDEDFLLGRFRRLSPEKKLALKEFICFLAR
ncbi:MAG: hypothetical protein A3G34_01875 [Candidatus Lindowbacteria bacterium RIFCSPLOWO2_12_FULL_62_27]|nr:MAG: hypothetical protein A3G34_01875 [Candidatus Lindowbacteria bacterium RIFCSPLOWO2_12_FULL_62_27]